MAVTEAQRKARDKWNAKYTELKLRVSPEKKAEIHSHATAQGESVNAFLTRAVEQAIAQDKASARE